MQSALTTTKSHVIGRVKHSTNLWRAPAQLNDTDVRQPAIDVKLRVYLEVRSNDEADTSKRFAQFASVVFAMPVCIAITPVIRVGYFDCRSGRLSRNQRFSQPTCPFPCSNIGSLPTRAIISSYGS